MTNYYAIIPAAGFGQRFGAEIPKQFQTIDGVSILDRSMAPFLHCEKIQKIVVVTNIDYPSPATSFQPVSTSPTRGEVKEPYISTTSGGETRLASVMNGLNALQVFAAEDDWVLVHDGVRPFLTINDLEKLIHVVGEHPVGGVLGVPVKDTLKKINENGEIVSTVERDNLWHAFTPQMFRYGLLKTALTQAKSSDVVITDESSAIELLGYQPLIVQGNPNNTKITFSEDLTQLEEA